MSLFNGLKFGRPAYPLYLADAFKPVEPTALGLLAQVSMMKGKAAKDADGTTKEEKVEALGGETSNWYDMQAETKALDERNKAMFSKVFKNHSNDYQDTPEFKKVIYPNMMKVESNKQLLKKNAVIGKTHLEEYNKANADLIAKFSEDEFAYDKNFKLIMGDDGNPLTRGKYNQLVYQNKNVNKEGLFIDPDFQYGVEYKSAITRIAKDINDAKETETREGLIGPQGTIVPGTYATGKSGSTSNVRKLNEMSWANSFKSTMSRPELEDAHLMYDHAILEGDGNAYKTEIIDDPDRKGKKKEVYSKDKDGNPIPIDFDGYMERVVEKIKTGKDIQGNNISLSYHGIPGAENEMKIKSGWYWQAGTGGQYWLASAEKMSVNLGQIITSRLRVTSTDLHKNSMYTGLTDSKDRLEVEMLNNFLNKPGNENATLEDYLKTQGGRSKEAGERIGGIIKKTEMQQIRNNNLGKDFKPVSTMAGLSPAITFDQYRNSSKANNLISSLLDCKIYSNALVSGSFAPMSFDRQEGSSYSLGTPVGADEVLYGFDHTAFKLGTKDHRTPVITSATQVIHIPKIDKNGNPLEQDLSDEGFVLTQIMVTPDRLEEMYALIKGKLTSYTDDDLKALMNQYVVTTTFGEAAKTYSADGKEAINYAKFKSSGWTSDDFDETVILVPVLMTAKHLIGDALDNKGEGPITPKPVNVDNTSDE